MSKSKVIFIAGPTSSGKTAVAISLAEKINGQIISCDSMQIYKDMDIITQAPNVEKIPVKHYLVKEFPPEEEFSAAEFCRRAEGIIASIVEEGKMPIIAGGTGLYMKALLEGLFISPPKDEGLRAELQAIAEEKGEEFLHGVLREVDPDSADNIHHNNVRRVIRAIEVFKLTGSTMNKKKEESRGIKDIYDCCIFALDLSREKLYAKINDLVDNMFSSGLIDEVKSLLDRSLSVTSSHAIGLNEVASFLQGESSLDDVKEQMKKNTRRYAKRQVTWIRGMEDVRWINADRSTDEIVNEIKESLNS